MFLMIAVSRKVSGITNQPKQLLKLSEMKTINDSTSPLAYLIRPKWIKDDASWEKIVNSIKLDFPSETDIT